MEVSTVRSGRGPHKGKLMGKITWKPGWKVASAGSTCAGAGISFLAFAHPTQTLCSGQQSEHSKPTKETPTRL